MAAHRADDSAPREAFSCEGPLRAVPVIVTGMIAARVPALRRVSTADLPAPVAFDRITIAQACHPVRSLFVRRAKRDLLDVTEP